MTDTVVVTDPATTVVESTTLEVSTVGTQGPAGAEYAPGAAWRVPYASALASLTDSASLTFDGTDLTAPAFVPSGATAPDNGIYLPAASTIGFAAGGNADAMNLWSDGNSARLSLNAAAGASSWNFYMIGPKTGGQCAYTMDAYGQENVILGRTALGTFASPSALTQDQMMMNFACRGYHSGGAFSTLSRVGMQFYASQNWTSAAQGTFINWYTTVDGSNAATSRMTLHNDGTLVLGLSGSAPLAKVANAGILQVNGALGVLDADLPLFRLLRAGSTKAYLAVGNGSSISGAAAAGDLVVRAEQQLVMRGGGDTGGIIIQAAGTVKMSSLAGTGTRAVVVDANGVLSAP